MRLSNVNIFSEYYNTDKDGNVVKIENAYGVYTKIDWFTAIFNDYSLNEVLDAVELPLGEPFRECIYHRAKSHGNLTSQLCFGLNGVRFEVPVFEAGMLLYFQPGEEDLSTVDAFFEITFSEIRVDISGSGLDYLRTLNSNVDSILRHEIVDCNGDRLNYHVTRVDFAFDFVNYKPNLTADIQALCAAYGNPETSRVPTGVGGGLKYQTRTGRERSVYLGAPSSPLLLRIYDKLFQYQCAHAMSRCPYDNCQSWHRVELQARRDQAEALLYCNSERRTDYVDVLQFVYQKFAIMKGARSKTVSEVWADMFDWDKLPRIIQNLHFASTCESQYNKSLTFVGTNALKSIYVVAGEVGWDKFVKDLNDLYDYIQTNKDFARRAAYLNTAVLSTTAQSSELPSHVVYDNGILKITR